MKTNNQLRVVGFFLLGGAALCGIVSYERYNSAIATAEYFQARSEDVFTELEAVTPPLVYVAGLLAIVLFSASIQCFILSRKSKQKPGQLLEVD